MDKDSDRQSGDGKIDQVRSSHAWCPQFLQCVDRIHTGIIGQRAHKVNGPFSNFHWILFLRTFTNPPTPGLEPSTLATKIMGSGVFFSLP